MEDWARPSTSRDDRPPYSPDRCCLCDKLLIPPVTRCFNGHGICYICWYRSSRNCYCGAGFQGEPHKNNLPPDAKFSCINRVRGCSQKLPLDVLEEHESTCPYNPHSPVAYCSIL